MSNLTVKLFWQLVLIFNLLICSSQVVPAAVLNVGAGITCGIQPDGTVACGGWAKAKKRKPAVVSFKEQSQGPFSQLSVGYAQLCAIHRDDLTLACLGGKYGIGRPPSGTFAQVSVSPFHACGVHTDGSVACWGGKGVPDYGQTNPPSDTFVQVSVGRWHTCGIKTDQTVVCWGNDRYDQTTPPNDTFIQISAAKFGWHTCGIKTDRTVVCWGSNDSGQALPPRGQFEQVSAGKWYTCGVEADDHSIICWGNNGDGQAEPPSGRFSYVSSGLFHACGIQADNAPICWGYDIWGGVKNISAETLPLIAAD